VVVESLKLAGFVLILWPFSPARINKWEVVAAEECRRAKARYGVEEQARVLYLYMCTGGTRWLYCVYPLDAENVYILWQNHHRFLVTRRGCAP
jgi:hypothetical protein